MSNLQEIEGDFQARARLPETTVPQDQWYRYGSWGPPARQYPPVAPPQANMSPNEWKNYLRERVVAAARRYIGLDYRHHHIPSWDSQGQRNSEGEVIADSGKGLDCSNATAWFYNFGNGMKFTSDIHRQAETVGRLLNSNEPLLPGDLLFFFRRDRSEVSHVGLFTGNNSMIDASGKFGVSEHSISGYYQTFFSHARRVVE